MCVYDIYFAGRQKKTQMSLAYSDHYLCSTANGKKLTCIWSTLMFVYCVCTVAIIGQTLQITQNKMKTFKCHIM